MEIQNPKLKLPVRFYLAGGSQTGKSTLLKGMIDNQEEIFERPFTNIKICRKAPDDLHLALKEAYPDLVDLVFGVPYDFLENLEETVTSDDNILLMFDDIIAEVAESKAAETLFYVSSGKFNISVILTSQNIFHQGSKLRNISLNCNLFGQTQNLRDATQIDRLARQLYPNNTNFLIDAYKKTMKQKPYNYLLVNLHPACDDRLRVFTGVLPNEERIYWQPKAK